MQQNVVQPNTVGQIQLFNRLPVLKKKKHTLKQTNGIIAITQYIIIPGIHQQ